MDESDHKISGSSATDHCALLDLQYESSSLEQHVIQPYQFELLESNDDGNMDTDWEPDSVESTTDSEEHSMREC